MPLPPNEANEMAIQAQQKYNLSELESQLLKLSYLSDISLTNEDYLQKITDLKPNDLVIAINNLASYRLLEFFMKDGNISYKAVQLDSLEKLDGLNEEEKRIYKVIEESGNEGIWTKTIKLKSNLHQNVVTKCLKTLESRNLIKSVRSIKNPTRKVYMLWENTPSIEVTGGPWYTDNTLDTQFVKILYDNLLKYIVSRSFPKPHSNATGAGAILSSQYQGYATAQDCLYFIQKIGLSNQPLNESDIKEILELMVLDGCVVKILGNLVQSNKMNLDEDFENETEIDWQYKAIYSGIVTQKDGLRNPIDEVPCGSCPVIHLCHPKGTINPFSCEYFNDWLDF